MRGKREKSLPPNEASLYKVRAQGSWGICVPYSMRIHLGDLYLASEVEET